MKWNNKSHEYDHIYEKFKDIFGLREISFCIFGAGKMGRECLQVFKEEKYTVEAIIDNDKNKQKSSIGGIEVISFDEYLNNHRDTYLLLAISDRNVVKIKEQLLSVGMKEVDDYSTYNYYKEIIHPVIKLYRDNKLHLNIVELALTERCTLKCKKCAHGCWNVPMNMPDMSIEKVKESMDELFDKADYINEFYLIGGEPLLYSGLDKAISYAGERYRGKIDKYIITTNGTIVPTQEVLEVAKKYRISFYISNYSVTLPQLKEKYKHLCEMLEEWGIDYQLSGEERVWFDYGFDYVDHQFDYNIVSKIHDECFTKCREIRGSRLYYCIQARSVSENLHFSVDDEEYLDLSKLKGNDAKKIIFEYSHGYCDKGYIDMCNFCNGSDSLLHPIPVAEQC